VGAVNFDPDDPTLDTDPRWLYFDRAGQLVERLDLPVKDIGWYLEVSPDGQWVSSIIDDYVQSVNLAETQMLTQTINISGKLLFLATPTSSNTVFSWAADNRNLVFMTGEYHTPDGLGLRRYGALYAFDTQSGRLTQLTDKHWIKSYAVSPLSD
jgi:hypothetical protein